MNTSDLIVQLAAFQMAADLSGTIGRLKSINDKYMADILAAAEDDTLHIRCVDLIQILNIAMAGWFVVKELGKKLDENDTAAETSQFGDDTEKLPPEMREFVDQLRAAGHDVNVTEIS